MYPRFKHDSYSTSRELWDGPPDALPVTRFPGAAHVGSSVIYSTSIDSCMVKVGSTGGVVQHRMKLGGLQILVAGFGERS